MSSENFKLYKSFGDLIKDYRHWQDLSQEELAQSIGVGTREVRRWEADRRRARFDNLHDLSEFTRIPMQVCVALNADQPIWYSLEGRRYAYSSLEARFFYQVLFNYRGQLDETNLVKMDRISTDKHISMIVSCHRESYGTLLRGDVIKAAARILPDLNIIFFDTWGHYVGHSVCLPIKKEVYRQLKRQKVLEDYLTTEMISDILAFGEGVFLVCSIFIANLSAAHTLLMNDLRFLAKIEQKGKYLIVNYINTKGLEEFCKFFGEKMVKTYGSMGKEVTLKLYEGELSAPFAGGRESLLKTDHGQEEVGFLTGKTEEQGLPAIPARQPNNVSKSDYNYLKEKLGYDLLSDNMPLSVDNDMPLSVDARMATRYPPSKSDKRKIEACRNPQCTLYNKTSQRNIVSNGIYRTKDGIPSHRFLCKECGKSFSNRTSSIFYNFSGLRSPEDKILTAFKFLVKGMPLRRVAKVINVKPHTVGYWLKVVSEQRGKIDTMLKKNLKVTQVELDTLWTFVRNNSLRQRVNLWKTKYDSISLSPKHKVSSL